MPAPWWDGIHEALWGVPGDAGVIRASARRVACEVVAPLIAAGARSAPGWTAGKQTVLESLDAAGLTSLVSRAREPVAMRMAVAAWELARVDGGAAACLFSGFLPQLIIRDFGTPAQRQRYLECPDRRHGALCLTEALPGAGADALRLEGTVKAARPGPDRAIILQVDKRGRFTSHMEFADFVVAAVAPADRTVRGSCLVILEPSDPGTFDRGTPERKLGHQLSSTTSPTFRMNIPPDRIVGGFAVDGHVLTPDHSHGEVLGPALRSGRTIVAVMTAAKILSAVETVIAHARNGGALAEDWSYRLADIWAVGEAAAALAFSAARQCDGPGRTGFPESIHLAGPCSRLFAAALASPCLLNAMSLIGPSAALAAMSADALVEAVYVGPESMERRQIAAAFDGRRFSESIEEWTREIREIGGPCLAAGMDLWRFVFGQLKEREEARGAGLCSDASQAVAFPLADALCRLVAAGALAVGVRDLRNSNRGDARKPRMAPVRFLADLAAINAARTAGAVGETCAHLLLGPAPRASLSGESLRSYGQLRARLDVLLRGSAGVRSRAAKFVRALVSARPPAEEARSPRRA
jgi:hypothetical protein